MSKLKYTDEFLRIAEYVENMEWPHRGLYGGTVFSSLNIPVSDETKGFRTEYRVAVDSPADTAKDISYFDRRLDPAIRPLLFCFLHAILSSGDSLQ
jgi:hypothetical protein